MLQQDTGISTWFVQVLADGVDIRELDSSWLRAQLGVVSQDIRLFSDTVAANIAYGYPSASQVRPSMPSCLEEQARAPAVIAVMVLSRKPLYCCLVWVAVPALFVHHKRLDADRQILRRRRGLQMHVALSATCLWATRQGCASTSLWCTRWLQSSSLTAGWKRG